MEKKYLTDKGRSRCDRVSNGAYTNGLLGRTFSTQEQEGCVTSFRAGR